MKKQKLLATFATEKGRVKPKMPINVLAQSEGPSAYYSQLLVVRTGLLD